MVLTRRSFSIVWLAIFLFASFIFGPISHGQAEDVKELQAYVEPYFIQFNNEEMLAENNRITINGKSYFPLDDVVKMLKGNIIVDQGTYHVQFSLLEERSIKMTEPFPKIQISTETAMLTFEESVHAQAAALIENNADHVMFSKNGNEKLYPASATKIMTALLALEHGDLNDVVKVSREVRNIPSDSSKAHIQPGDQLTLEQLIYAMMIPSGNDAAVAVAAHIAGSEKEFVKKMNEKAKEIGADNTNFMNPHGYHDPKQYTTAIDLAKIAYEASKYEQFLPFVSTPRYTITYKRSNGSSVTRTWNATNQQIRKDTSHYSPIITGGKTGYTSASRHTLISFAQNNDNQYIAVILKGDRNQRYADTLRLVKSAIKERDAYERKYKKSVTLSFGEKSLYVNGNIVNTGERLFSYEGKLYIPEKSIEQLSNQLENFLIAKTQFKKVFKDVRHDFWAIEEIDYLTTKQMIHGYPDRTFKPYATLNRLQVAIILNRLPSQIDKYPEERGFTDFPKGHKHYGVVNNAVQACYFDKLISNNEFKPYQEVTRAELAYILSNVFELNGESDVTFSDVDKIHWAHDYIHALAANNVTLGYPDLTFKPDELINRVQFSIFLARAMNDYFKPGVKEIEGKEFIYWGDEAGFYKTSVDNEQTITLHPYAVHQYYVVNDYIYFLSETYRHISDQGFEPHGQIYRIKKDGSNKTQLSDDIVEAFAMVDDKILYRYTGHLQKNGYVVYGEPSIKSIDVDGKNQKVITNISTLDMKSHKGWIYFTNANDDGKLYRINKDGSKTEKLTVDRISDFALIGDDIFYIPAGADSSEEVTVKMTLAGTDKTSMKIHSLPFTIIDHYMFYKKDGTGIDYIMKSTLDGSDSQKLGELDVYKYLGKTDTEIWFRDDVKGVFVRLPIE